MKSMLKHTALLVSLLAGLHLLVGGLVRTGFIGDGYTVTGWIETFFRFVLTPTPTTTLWILALSLSVLVTLSFLERTKRKSSPPLSPPPHPISLPPTPPRPSIGKEHVSKPWRPPDRHTITNTKARVNVSEEWHDLDEVDKEVIREIVSQKGLWENDIVALLQARGFLHSTATFDPLAERVSFVHCDYAGYHSIPPEYQTQVEGVIANDYREGFQ